MLQSNPLVLISIYAVALPFITGMLRWKYMGYPGKALTILTGLAALNELINRIAASTWGNNMPFLHTWVFIEFTIVLMIYSHLFGWKKWTPWILAVFIATGILLEFTVAGPLEFPRIFRSLENILIILLSVSWFIHALTRKSVPAQGSLTGFWIAASHLVYFAGSFTLFTMVSFVLKNEREAFQQVWIFHAFLLILLYLGYTIAILCKENPTPASYRSFGSAV